MASRGERKPANFATLQGASAPQRQVYKGPSEHQEEGASAFCSSVSSSKSPLQSVTSAQQPKSHDYSCSAGSVASNSGDNVFDICPSVNKSVIKLARPLHEINREKRREKKLSKDVAPLQYLRPGMFLLKGFLKSDDQVKIVKLCRQLGVGRGGFYKPGYRDGAKLNLHMMCLGMNWDPDSHSYGHTRPFDGAEPPDIPEEFRKFVQYAMQFSHGFLEKSLGAVNVVEELPPMSPDICLVNFYGTSGTLGLHQDKDETKASLDKGLPVVSFSIGETAEFRYGDVRDADKAEKVDLESGDVIIFGGKSRHIFHGVSSIKPKTAPIRLIDETNMRPGRLNLTFRQY